MHPWHSNCPPFCWVFPWCISVPLAEFCMLQQILLAACYAERIEVQSKIKYLNSNHAPSLIFIDLKWALSRGKLVSFILIDILTLAHLDHFSLTFVKTIGAPLEMWPTMSPNFKCVTPWTPLLKSVPCLVPFWKCVPSSTPLLKSSLFGHPSCIPLLLELLFIFIAYCIACTASKPNSSA